MRKITIVLILLLAGFIAFPNQNNESEIKSHLWRLDAQNPCTEEITTIGFCQFRGENPGGEIFNKWGFKQLGYWILMEGKLHVSFFHSFDAEFEIKTISKNTSGFFGDCWIYGDCIDREARPKGKAFLIKLEKIKTGETEKGND